MRFYRYFKEDPPPGTERLSSNDIIERVCKYFGHPVEFVMNKTKKKEYVKTRYIIAYLLAQDMYLNMSMTSIAFSIGKRDHSTIVYAVKKVRDDMEVYEPILELVYDVFVFVYGSDAYFPKDLKKLIKDEVRKD